MGHIIPAGTGFDGHRNLELQPQVDPIEVEETANPLLEESEPLVG